ncbi:MAG TPA: helix-turn-helix domain-containing protein [Nocardioides sp.]|nr:helix-turn-helix domain-containing protein [Nocardioides sp.]
MADDQIASLRAAAHPLRLRMLSLLTGSAMSAAEVARELDITHANASYHLRVLRDAGEVVVDGEERIRGGMAKRYRHPWQDAKAFRGTNPRDREQEIRAMGNELVRRYGRRRASTAAVLCDAELWVTEEVWEEARELVRRAAVLIHEQARPPHSEGAVHVNLTAAGFQMDEETTR